MHKSELVINKNAIYHLGLAPHQINPNLIFVGDPARAYRVAAHFEAIQYEVKHREFVTLSGTYKNQNLTVMGTGIGTDNVEIALIEAYALLCFDLQTQQPLAEVPNISILRIGTSGGVQPALDAGTMGLTKYAIGLDSTGLFYDHEMSDPLVAQLEEECFQLLNQNTSEQARFKGKIRPYASCANAELLQNLQIACNAAVVPHQTGITVSSPGFYGPSGRYIKGLKNTIPDIKMKLAQLNVRGHTIINMEMESSLIFHLAQQLGIKCGTICPIISNPTKSDQIIDYQKSVDKAIEIGLTALIQTIG